MISICIPAYNRVNLLTRLLDSIAIQTFSHFEVIVTDDSPNNSVEKICESYNGRIPIKYYKNPIPLGTPENWNEAVRRASGEWIKIMHDDDWFSGPESLAGFFALTKQCPQADFVFSGSSIYEDARFLKDFTISEYDLKLLKADPANLFCRNSIGPPSVVMYRNNGRVVYDKRMKWLVDVDFYIEYLKFNKTFFFTKETLINVGFNAQQVTNQVIHDKLVVLPETFMLLNKIGTKILGRIWNYDFLWRLMRNYQIREMRELESLNNSRKDLSKQFATALSWQRYIPGSLLKIGVLSKTLMFFNFLVYKFTVKRCQE